MQLSNKNVREALKYIGFLVVGFIAAFAIGFGVESTNNKLGSGFRLGLLIFSSFFAVVFPNSIKKVFPNRNLLFYAVICLPVSLILGSLVWFLIIKS